MYVVYVNHGSEICNTNIMGDRFKKSHHDFLLNPFCMNSVVHEMYLHVCELFVQINKV